MNDTREYLHRMEEYIPPVEAAAPGGRDNRDPTDPNQLRSGAASGEMQLDGSSIASSSLPDMIPKRVSHKKRSLKSLNPKGLNCD